MLTVLALAFSLLVGLLLPASVPAERTIQVAIDERQRPGTPVRDLRTLVMPGAAMRFSFHLVQAPQLASKYFAIENTSVLVTKLDIMKDVLVREQLCTADDCKLALQVNATGKRFVSDVLTPTEGRTQGAEEWMGMGEEVYQLLNLQITVNSVIEQPCKFDKAVTTQDVNELSDSQTFINLGNLNCPRLPQSVYLRLTLVDAAGNVVPQNRSAGFRLRHVLIKSKPQSLFRVDLVAPASLDREVCEWHNFTVLATVAELETSARVFVHVDDADDNEPQFLHASYALVVREDAPPGEVVRLQAQDADSLPQNTEFEYTLVSTKCRLNLGDAECPKDTFVLNARTGALTLLRTLNYEHISRWTFVCGLRVYGALVNSTTTVTVDVMNVNEPPSITGCKPDTDTDTDNDASASFVVPENAHEQRTICVVKARDEDGDSVKCELSYDPFASHKFDVRRFFHLTLTTQTEAEADTDTFWNLTTAAFPLDYEDEREHRVMLLCTDSPRDNRPQLTASVVFIITVQNRNDPPKFSQPFFKLQLPENDERTAVVKKQKVRYSNNGYTVIIPNISFAVDPAFANLSDVHLAILPSAQDRAIEAAFQLRANDLVVNDAFVFDRESRQWYNFSLLARLTSEPTLASTVPVSVEIADRNDNSPVFTTGDENMTVDVRVDTLVGRQVYCCVRATDRDAGANGRVQYVLVSDIAELSRSKRERLTATALDAREYFTIDAQSGELFLGKALNASLAGLVVRLVVEARDQPLAAGDVRSASTVLRLRLIKPQQLFVGSRPHLTFSFGEFHNVVVIAMIVGVTVLVSGLLIGLIVCIKSKNSQRRAQHAAQLSASLNGNGNGNGNGRSMVKSANLKVKLQSNGGYSRFRQAAASPNHYFNVSTYAPNVATDIDYPDSTTTKQYAAKANCAASNTVPLQYEYVAGSATHGKAALPQQAAIESLDSSLASSPKGTVVMRSFATEQAQQGNISCLPPLNTDLDSAATDVDIDSGQGSSTSTCKATDSCLSNNRRSSTETSTVTDSSELVTFDRSLPPAGTGSAPGSHPLQAHDIYCTCSRRHGASTLSRTSAPSPLPMPLAYRRNMQQTAMLEQDSSSLAVKSILRNTGQGQAAAVHGHQHQHQHLHQHYLTMLPKRTAQSTVSTAVQNGERRSFISKLSSSEV